MVTPDDELDVVARLFEHQRNLPLLPPASPRVAVVGLPLPPLCAALGVRALFARSRATELERLAEREGGSLGPALVVDLDQDDRALGEHLADLARVGVEELVLHGAPDQPGFARACALRFAGVVRLAPRGQDSAIAALMDDPGIFRDLGGGVARIRGRGVVLGQRFPVILVGLERGESPDLAGPRGVEVRPYALDPARSLGPYSGLLPPGVERGPAIGEREAWRLSWAERGRAAEVVAAALGHDPALEARLRQGGDSHARAVTDRPLVVALTGLDGAGKSSHAEELGRACERRGLVARTVKIYRRGAFLDLAGELGARTRAGAPLGAFRVARLVKLVDSLRVLRDELEPAARLADVLVFDRHVETHLAAARAQLGWDLAQHPALQVFPPPDVTFLLHLDPASALERVAERGEPRSADEHEVGLRGYARELDKLADADPEGWARLDASAPLEHNRERLAARTLALAAEVCVPRSRRLPPTMRSLPPPPLAGPSGARGSTAVVIGGERGACPDGADALALCAFARSRLGVVAAGFPEAFWLEAYAAQLLLDLRAAGGGTHRVALWPPVLLRLPLFADLGMLDELGKLVLAGARLTGYVPGGGSAAREALAVLAPAGAARLADAYARALEEFAREHGLPPVATIVIERPRVPPAAPVKTLPEDR